MLSEETMQIIPCMHLSLPTVMPTAVGYVICETNMLYTTDLAFPVECRGVGYDWYFPQTRLLNNTLLFLPTLHIPIISMFLLSRLPPIVCFRVYFKRSYADIAMAIYAMHHKYHQFRHIYDLFGIYQHTCLLQLTYNVAQLTNENPWQKPITSENVGDKTKSILFKMAMRISECLT